ncbi:decaprenylphospho-beta-D-erythro-pentofuranosid-2-ulose 2-reductase [Streptomyces hirsutus]
MGPHRSCRGPAAGVLARPRRYVRDRAGTARRLIARRTRTVWLAAAALPRALDRAAEQLRGLGAQVRAIAFDALDPASHENVLGKVFTDGDIDMVLVAFGTLGDQAHDERSPGTPSRSRRTTTPARSPRASCARAPSRTRGTAAWWCCRPSPASGPAARTYLRLQQGRPGHLRPGPRRRAVRHGRARHGPAPRLRPCPDGGRPQGARLATTPEAVATAVELGLRRRAETGGCRAGCAW